MQYMTYKPAAPLSNYIHSYWIVENRWNTDPHMDERAGWYNKPVFPDGGTELVFNLGRSASWLNENIEIGEKKALFMSTKTSSGNLSVGRHGILAGIRFKPGGIISFYDLPVADWVNGAIPFSDPALERFFYGNGGVGDAFADDWDRDAGKRVFHLLDQHFSRQYNHCGSSVYELIREVCDTHGKITVEDLCRKHHIGIRTLQRSCKQVLGITPRELIKITRFQHVLSRLEESVKRESLLRIAFENGYYDHAHLTHEFKRYAGVTPMDIIAARPRSA